MKKALMVLLAVAIVGSFAFAADPATFKLIEFTGNAAVSMVVDIDHMSIGFDNTVSTSLKIELAGAGDKVTAGEGTWAELKIKTDGDSLRVTAPTPALAGGNVIVDVAKIHFGPNLYLNVKGGSSQIDYAGYPDVSGNYYTPLATRYSGVDAKLVGSVAGALGPAFTKGIEVGFSVPSVVDIVVDFDSAQWADATSPILPDLTKNNFGLKAKASLTAVADLTAEAAFGTGFGGVNQKYDSGVGVKVAYALKLGDTYTVTPSAALNYGMFGSRATPNSAMSLSGGVIFGWGAKAKTPALYFSKEEDAYPGVSVAVTMKGKDYVSPSAAKDSMGLNVGFLSGTLVPNLTAMVAFAIDDLNAAKQKMGFTVNGKYAITADALTITPKFGLNYYNNANLTTAASKMYAAAGVDVAGLINNTTFSAEWKSNDISNGLSTTIGTATTSDKMGKLTVTCKVAF